jgi:hypothetical protein
MERTAIEVEKDLAVDPVSGDVKAQARVQPGTLTHQQMLDAGFGHSSAKGFYYTRDPAVMARGRELAGQIPPGSTSVTPAGTPVATSPTQPPVQMPRPVANRPTGPLTAGSIVLTPVERPTKKGKTYIRYETTSSFDREANSMLATAGMKWDGDNKVWFVYTQDAPDVVANLEAAQDPSHERHEEMKGKIQERIEKKDAESRVETATYFNLEGHDEVAYNNRNATTALPGSELIPQTATKFFPYQQAAVVQARGHKGCFLFDDMGVGKTSTAIGMINDRAANVKPVQNVLIICPLIVRSKWVSEVKRFLAGPGLRNEAGQMELKLDSVKRDPATNRVAFPDANIVVIPWHMTAQFEEQIYGRHWDMVIVDEGHRGKHPGTQWTQAINGKYDKKAKTYVSPGIPRDQTVILTGTPPEKSWEYHSLFRMADPEHFQSDQQFRDSFAEQRTMRVERKQKKDAKPMPGASDDDSGGKMQITVPVGPKNEELLNKMLYGGGSTTDGEHIDVVGMRRMLEDVQPQLPPFQTNNFEVDPSDILDDPEASADVYAPNLAKAKEASTYLAQVQRSQEYANVLSLDRAIQQAIREKRDPIEIQDLDAKLSMALKVGFEERSQVRRQMGMRKVPVVNQTADYIRSEEPTAKIVIFCVHKEVVAAIAAAEQAKANAEAEAINQQNARIARESGAAPAEPVKPWKVVVITGDESGEQRDIAKDTFQEDPTVKVVVCTFGAAKEGIELTAGNHEIVAELPDTIESIEQAQRRIRRIGQTQPAFAHVIIDPRGLDYVTYKRLIRNKKVRNAINASTSPGYAAIYRTILGTHV